MPTNLFEVQNLVVGVFGFHDPVHLANHCHMQGVLCWLLGLLGSLPWLLLLLLRLQNLLFGHNPLPYVARCMGTRLPKLDWEMWRPSGRRHLRCGCLLACSGCPLVWLLILSYISRHGLLASRAAQPSACCHHHAGPTPCLVVGLSCITGAVE